MRTWLLAATAVAATMALAQPALAAPAQPQFGDPVKVGDGFSIDPIIDLRLRYENVTQTGAAVDADAVTARLRAGFELKHASGLSFLAEGEGTLGIVTDYSAFPGTFSAASVGFSHQRRPGYATVADPQNIELNRLQLQYRSKLATVTIGRQRINLDDQRFVGSVGWRQNEQTFDAARLEAKLGPVSLDATYANSQRTIYGIDAGPRQAYGGDFVFLGAGAKLGPVNLKAFGYLLDYDEAIFFANSSQTYGARATASFKLAPKTTLALAASYARQSSYGTNPVHYAADYIAAEAALGYDILTLTAGYELLGADSAAGKSFQTPMATLHKFNGWADAFLVTPATGLQDIYGGAAIKLPMVKALPGLNAAVVYHDFRSDVGSVKFGAEWDASLGFKLHKVGLLAKYASYNPVVGPTLGKFWLQAEVAF